MFSFVEHRFFVKYSANERKSLPNPPDSRFFLSNVNQSREGFVFQTLLFFPITFPFVGLPRLSSLRPTTLSRRCWTKQRTKSVFAEEQNAAVDSTKPGQSALTHLNHPLSPHTHPTPPPTGSTCNTRNSGDVTARLRRSFFFS